MWVAETAGRSAGRWQIPTKSCFGAGLGAKPRVPRATSVCLSETMVTSTERLVDTNGVRLRLVEAGERGAPVVVLAHGFPELAYSWRHQIGVLAEAGYHVLAPDQRGYGGSSKPDAIEDYNVVALCGDCLLYTSPSPRD